MRNNLIKLANKFESKYKFKRLAFIKDEIGEFFTDCPNIENAGSNVRNTCVNVAQNLKINNENITKIATQAFKKDESAVGSLKISRYILNANFINGTWKVLPSLNSGFEITGDLIQNLTFSQMITPLLQKLDKETNIGIEKELNNLTDKNLLSGTTIKDYPYILDSTPFPIDCDIS